MGEARKRQKARRGRGENACYYEESTGQYCYVVELPRVGGKRRRVKVRHAEKREAIRRGEAIKRQGPLVDAERVPLDRFLPDWLDGLLARGKVRETSHARYSAVVRRHLVPYWGATVLQKITQEHVDLFADDLIRRGVPVPTQRMALRVLSTAMKAAVKKKLIAANPCTQVERPAPQEGKINPLDEEEAARFLAAAAGHELHALFVLALGTGLRVGELLALHWSDVDLDKGTVEVRHTLSRVKKQLVLRKPKTRAARRVVTIAGTTLETLRAHRARREQEGLLDRAVFCTRTGGYMYRDQAADRAFPKLLAKAGLAKRTFHQLRHSHASILLSRGMSVVAVAARLGHKKPDVTLRVYAHKMPRDDARLAACIEEVLGGTLGSR